MFATLISHEASGNKCIITWLFVNNSAIYIYIYHNAKHVNKQRKHRMKTLNMTDLVPAILSSRGR